MQIYTLSSLGSKLSHTARHEGHDDEWALIYYLAKVHRASNDELKNQFGSAFNTLARKGIIQPETTVGV